MTTRSARLWQGPGRGASWGRGAAAGDRTGGLASMCSPQHLQPYLPGFALPAAPQRLPKLLAALSVLLHPLVFDRSTARATTFTMGCVKQVAAAAVAWWHTLRGASGCMLQQPGGGVGSSSTAAEWWEASITGEGVRKQQPSARQRSAQRCSARARAPPAAAAGPLTRPPRRRRPPRPRRRAAGRRAAASSAGTRSARGRWTRSARR